MTAWEEEKQQRLDWAVFILFSVLDLFRGGSIILLTLESYVLALIKKKGSQAGYLVWLL